jgi:ATP synthase assembly factor FMC1
MEFTLGPSVTTAIFSPQHFRSGLLQHPISKSTVAPQLRIIPNQFAHNKTNKMAQTPTPQIRSIYRRLLRELPSTPQTTRTQHQKLSSPSKLQQRIRQTQAQRTHSTLLERYNPGMGMTEEERVRLSARRVGINLPVEYQEEK